MCIEAAKSGRHIIVEKPATLTLEEFDRVAEACTSNGVKLCQIQNKMFEPVMLSAISQVKSGNIGEVLGVNIQLLSQRTAEQARDPGHWCHELPAGIFTEVLPHPIYLVQTFLGAVELMGVHVGHAGRKNRVNCDAIAVILEGARGIGLVDYSGPYPKNKVIINVYGTRKSLRIDLWNSSKVEFGVGGSGKVARAFENLRQEYSLLASTMGTALSVLTGGFHSGHYNIIDSFVQSVRDGAEQPISMEQAREVIRVLEDVTRMATKQLG
jgi:predicted dehydrogenase